MNKNLIIIPTFNEALNIKNLIIKIFRYQKKIDLLFIDDNNHGNIINNILKKYSYKGYYYSISLKKFIKKKTKYSLNKYYLLDSHLELKNYNVKS
jgi:hypothetical protein